MAEHAALYLRLSREDSSESVSESIESQRMQLMQYAATHGIRIDAVFSDDGISGTRWDREGLHAMLRAIEDGWITTVLVKDLSRLSRDYIRTGELLEQWFPAHGVRLISVGDAMDTAAPSISMDYTPFRAVMDDWYARDASKKVRSALCARQLAGMCTAACLPYGYARCGEKICAVNPDTVRRIFDEYMQSESCRRVAEILNNTQIPPPCNTGIKWNDVTVRNILRNTAYIGELRLRTTQKISYKCRKRLLIPPEENLIFRVEPIISSEQFEKAQVLLAKHAHHTFPQHWLNDHIRCGECGARVILSHEKSNIRLICGGRKRGSGCRNPSAKLEPLLCMASEQLILQGIPSAADILPQLIERIRLYEKYAEVFLRCRLPQK